MMISVGRNEVLLKNAEGTGWLHFLDPEDILWTSRPEDVVTTLRDVEEAVLSRGLSAAGFVAYEAASAFDPALKVHPAGDFPLVWFVLTRRMRELPLDFSPLATGGLDAGPRTPGSWTPSITEEEYRAAVREVRAAIGEGETYQVNFSYRLRSAFRGDPLSLFGRLVRAQRAQHAAYVDTGRYVICSASPELFFRLDGRTIVSRPMKGTAPRGLTPADDAEHGTWLRSSEKNRAENLMIVDMMRNDIGRLAVPGSVRVPAMFELEKYPTLWQMTSTVEGETAAGLVDIFGALFPAASITGAPKPATMGIIRKLESTPRRIYTGSVGYLLPGRRALFNVAIRTLLLERERTASSGEMTAEYGVGGGIVWNSTEKSELEESRIKALVLTEEIPEFSLLETMLWTPEGGGYELLDLHIERLIGSGKYFSIRVNPEEVRRMLSDLAHRLRRVPHRVRLLVAEEGALSFDAQPWRKPPPDCRVRLAREPVASTNRFLYHKTTNRAVYDGALAQLSDCDDVLLWNERGELTESTIANLLLELDGEFVTPPVSSGLLPGVYREWMLRSGGARERVVTPADLRGAQRVFLMNSVRGKYEVRVLTEDEPGKGP